MDWLLFSTQTLEVLSESQNFEDCQQAARTMGKNPVVIRTRKDFDSRVAHRHETAVQFVDRALRACLPPGVPPSYTAISSARFIGSGRKREAHADLVMFDGRPGRVRVWLWADDADAFAHEWIDTGSEPCSFEGGQWVRIDPETLEPVDRTTTDA